ncbi:hypothetical protein M0R45_009976 [Rubus argutus]|uniref:Ionotropic glutamate receptor C-terminal domain-containing protein n=1 Tax=Rubus argutus TaxID=59490 RepID=A0AAW1Y6N1_RUBAR
MIKAEMVVLLTALGDRLAEKMHKISYNAVLPPDPNSNSRSTSSWLSTVLDSKRLSEETKDSIQGALTLRPHTPDSKRKRDFISRWNKLSNGSMGLNPYGLYAYDTVWMIAHAVNLLLDQGGTISFSNHTIIPGFGGGTMNLGALSIFNGGKQLLENILQTNMTVPYKFVLFGDGHKNPSYNELVEKIALGDFDAAVGDILIVTNRTKIVDFSQPYIESGLVVVAPVRRSNSRAWAFLKPFSPWMWGVTVAFFLIVGSVLWILEHRLNDEFRGPPRKQIGTILWFSFSTMFFSHRENIVSTLGRMGSKKGLLFKNYLIEELNIPKSRLVPLGSPKEYATALKKRIVAAVVDEGPYIELFLSDNCMLSIRGQEFTKSGWGFAFPRDSPLAIDMSTAILTLSENGELQQLHEKWLSRKSFTLGQLPETSYGIPPKMIINLIWSLLAMAACEALVGPLQRASSLSCHSLTEARKENVRKLCQHQEENVSRNVSTSNRGEMNDSQEIFHTSDNETW